MKLIYNQYYYIKNLNSTHTKARVLNIFIIIRNGEVYLWFQSTLKKRRKALHFQTSLCYATISLNKAVHCMRKVQNFFINIIIVPIKKAWKFMIPETTCYESRLRIAFEFSNSVNPHTSRYELRYIVEAGQYYDTSTNNRSTRIVPYR